MTDVACLVKLIEQDPDTDILAAMLIDELMEARGMLRSEAERHVRHVQADARIAKQIDFVARLLRAKGPAYTYLCRAIERHLMIQEVIGYTLYVVSGDGPPRFCRVGDVVQTPTARHGYPIAIPAGWVIHWFRQNTYPIEPVRRPRRR